MAFPMPDAVSYTHLGSIDDGDRVAAPIENVHLRPVTGQDGNGDGVRARRDGGHYLMGRGGDHREVVGSVVGDEGISAGGVDGDLPFRGASHVPHGDVGHRGIRGIVHHLSLIHI